MMVKTFLIVSPVLVAAVSPAPLGSGKALEEVFDVFTGHPTLHSSCDGPKLGPLKAAWDLIHQMNAAAMEALTSPEYENKEEYRRLATRFFGIRPNVRIDKHKKTSTEHLPQSAGDLGKLNRVLSRSLLAPASHVSILIDDRLVR